VTFKLDANSAKSADNFFSSIRESGKYIGIITRAEALNSQHGTTGLGLSFKANDGSTADYLDIYTTKANGDVLMGMKTVNALLACLKLREIRDSRIKYEKWNKDTKKREMVEMPGYPDLMGKPIGLLLQKELGTNDQTGADTEKMVIFGVFNADTELTASEILEGKTKPERLSKMLEALIARPIRDNRTRGRSTAPAPRAASQHTSTGTGFDDMDDDIPF
jgi:hypothetical protein